MELFNAIFFRRAVRKYSKELLSTEELDKISDYLKNIKQLDCPQVEFLIVGKDSVTYKNAPHCVLAYSNQNVKELVNVGYTLQKLDLYLQSQGLGSIFLGLPKPKNEVEKENYTIMLAFGKTDVAKRSCEDDFDRLVISEVSNSNCMVARSIRLAPSACNSQPWKIECSNEQISISYVGRGVFKRILKPKFSKIDIGIALAHAELALIHEGNTITAIEVFSDDKNDNTFGAKISFTKK